jgi:CTP synthase
LPDHYPNSSQLPDANSTEFDENTKHPAIVFMPEISTTHMGGTMRLGLRPTVFEEGTEAWSKVRRMYAHAPKIWERHRHRWEVNPEMVPMLEKSGLRFIGKDEKGERMQVLELPGTRFNMYPLICH